MYPLFRSKLFSFIFTNLCLGNGFLSKRISLAVMSSYFKSFIDLGPIRISILSKGIFVLHWVVFKLAFDFTDLNKSIRVIHVVPTAIPFVEK